MCAAAPAPGDGCAGRAVRSSARIVHIETDALAAESRIAASAHTVGLAVRRSWRSNAARGRSRRRHPDLATRSRRPFTAKQIALLQTFADQAVIAVENVRLFTELEARNKELDRSAGAADGDGGGAARHRRSQTDVQPVFDAIMDSAVRLCGAIVAYIVSRSRRAVRLVLHELDPGSSEASLEQCADVTAPWTRRVSWAATVVDRRESVHDRRH